MSKNSDKNKNLTPFAKGVSGNPNGRPKGQKNYRTLYREALIKLAEQNDKEPDELELEMLQNAIKSARAGNFTFYKDILDRLYGKAVQPNDFTSNGESIKFILNPDLANDISPDTETSS